MVDGDQVDNLERNGDDYAQAVTKKPRKPLRPSFLRKQGNTYMYELVNLDRSRYTGTLWPN